MPEFMEQDAVFGKLDFQKEVTMYWSFASVVAVLTGGNASMF